MPSKTKDFKSSNWHSFPERTDEQCQVLWDLGEQKLPGVAKSVSVIADMATEDEKRLGAVEFYYRAGEMTLELNEKLSQIKSGNLTSIEETFLVQAEVLHAAFLKWLQVANAQSHPVEIERYTNMALRFQKQCQQALKALAEMKNPRRNTTFIKNQQNVLSVESAEHQNQLEQSFYAENLDTIAASAPIGVNSSAAPLDAQYGSKNIRRES